MRILCLMFVLISIAGTLLGNLVAGALALAFAGLCWLASRLFDRQDQQWLRDPAHARLPVDTLERNLAESECSGIYVPQELRDLQAAGQLANPNEDPR